MPDLVLSEAAQFSSMMRRIASEIASGMCTPDEVPEHFSIPVSAWEEIQALESWPDALARAHNELGGAQNAIKRIRMKAAVAVEDALLVVSGLIYNTDSTPAARLDAFKQLVGIAGAEPSKETKDGGGQTFSITINTGDGSQGVTINGTSQPAPEPSYNMLEAGATPARINMDITAGREEFDE